MSLMYTRYRNGTWSSSIGSRVYGLSKNRKTFDLRFKEVKGQGHTIECLNSNI